MYLILSSYLPFHGSNQAEVYKAVKNGSFSFEHEEFTRVHASAKDLIKRLLTVDKTQRINCADALKHPWFTDALDSKTNASPVDRKVPQLDFGTL